MNFLFRFLFLLKGFFWGTYDFFPFLFFFFFFVFVCLFEGGVVVLQLVGF